MSIVSAALWALVATVVAFLPMRWQYPPGIVLLIAAPVIIVMLGQEYGWLEQIAVIEIQDSQKFTSVIPCH